MNCPICGIEMSEVKNSYYRVMDGNFVWQCQNNTDHRFFEGARQSNVIFQNPNASETTFDAIAGWKYTINPLVFTKMDKTEWYGKWYLQIGRFDASSKTGNECGHYYKELTLDQRTWKCPTCGIVYDREVNAALNIRDWAFITWNREQNEIKIPTDGGKSKSVRSKDDKQRKPKKVASGKVFAGQKDVSARTSESPTL